MDVPGSRTGISEGLLPCDYVAPGVPLSSHRQQITYTTNKPADLNIY
jgi:hypothetical protein